MTSNKHAVIETGELNVSGDAGLNFPTLGLAGGLAGITTRDIRNIRGTPGTLSLDRSTGELWHYQEGEMRPVSALAYFFAEVLRGAAVSSVTANPIVAVTPLNVIWTASLPSEFLPVIQHRSEAADGTSTAFRADNSINMAGVYLVWAQATFTGSPTGNTRGLRIFRSGAVTLAEDRVAAVGTLQTITTSGVYIKTTTTQEDFFLNAESAAVSNQVQEPKLAWIMIGTLDANPQAPTIGAPV